MDHLSSGESSKPHSPQKAFLIEELKEAKRTIPQKEEALRQMEERLQRLEMQHERPPEQRRQHHRYEQEVLQIIKAMMKKPNGEGNILKIGANMWQSLIYHL